MIIIIIKNNFASDEYFEVFKLLETYYPIKAI